MKVPFAQTLAALLLAKIGGAGWGDDDPKPRGAASPGASPMAKALKYLAAHVGGFAALAFAAGFALNRDWAQAGASLATAAAAWGINLRPSQQ